MTTQILISNEKTASDIQYICGAPPPEVAVLIKTGKNIRFIVSEMESNRMQRTVNPSIMVVYPSQIGSDWKSGAADWIKRTLKEGNIDSVEVPANFPIGVADQLRKSNIDVKVSAKAICPGREVKNEKEIKSIQQSQRAAVAAMKAAIELIASAEPGADHILRIGKTILTSEKVRAAIGHILLDHECVAEETIVSCGPASADPHERGEGPLFGGRPIVLDIFPKSGKTGYWGDITRTVCRGPAPAALKKQYNAVKAAQAAQLKMLKAGVWTHTIHKSGAELMEARGFKTQIIDAVPQGFIHGTGHGVGLDIHEAPRVSSANRQKLRAGHIITIEPGLYYSELGGVRIEDTVSVTRDAYQMLAPFPKKLEI